jgi:DNA/RNA endonuclease YhcR with UshA esterase domain
MLRHSGFVITRMQSLLVAGIVNIGILVMAGPVSAHHAVQAQFDVNKTITITGTVSKIEWINPHSYLTLNVKDADGKIQKWAFELAAPAVLRRAGMSREDRGGLKPGDEITVTGLASKDGSNSGWLQEIKLADGRVIKLVTGPNGN